MNDGFNFGKNLVVVSGPAGAGKDTIVNELLKLDDRFSLSVSATTRKPRDGEKEGINYYYISENDFVEKINNNEFIEYTQYGLNRYGTLKSDVEKRILNGKIVFLIIEVEGAANIKKIYPDALSIFILPPDIATLEKRLRGRNTESEDDIKRRLDIALYEIEQKDNYDCRVYNSELEKSVIETYNIIKNKLDI